MDLWSMFCPWIQSNYRIEFSNLSFPIAHFPAGRLTGENSGEFLWRIHHPAGSWMAAARIFPQFTLVAWASAHRLIVHLTLWGSAVTVLTFQCLCSSFNIQFDRDPFDVFICCSTVILKNALMLKVALKIVTLIFWDCFHLDFKDHVSRRKYYAARNLSCDRCE